MNQYLDAGVLRKLKDFDFFNSVNIFFDTICWENEIERKKVLNLLDEDGTWKILETLTGNELVEKIGEFEYDTYAGKRKFIVMADNVVDPEKGSGAMTISCNHSADDYDLGKRKKLDVDKGRRKKY